MAIFILDTPLPRGMTSFVRDISTACVYPVRFRGYKALCGVIPQPHATVLVDLSKEYRHNGLDMDE